MNIDDFDVDHKRKIALIHLAAGKSVKFAAEKSTLHPKTVLALQKTPRAQRIIKMAVAEIYNSALAELSLGCYDVVQELMRIVRDPEASDRAKISAGDLILKHAERARDLILENRIEEIEDSLNVVEIKGTEVREITSSEEPEGATDID